MVIHAFQQLGRHCLEVGASDEIRNLGGVFKHNNNSLCY
jgi:hypothetical protein